VKLYLVGIVVACFSLLAFTMIEQDQVYAVQYSNHTSEKYKIQFDYPSNWFLDERTDRFNDQEDKFSSPDGFSSIGIVYTTDLMEAYGTKTLRSAISDWVESFQRNDFSNQYQTIEPPSYVEIDNEKSGTVVYSAKEKFNFQDPVRLGIQAWVTFIDGNWYTIVYKAPTDKFDSPENIEIRERLIKSVRFLGDDNRNSDVTGDSSTGTSKGL
jgi:hypothetical protein